MIQWQLSQEAADHYQEAARRLMERYSWQLLPPEELVAGALGLTAGNPDSSISKALVGAYCIVMYHAFLGAQGTEQQHRACNELGHALSSLLVRDYPLLPSDERADVVQNTLERIWRARDNCREPAAFLAFATGHLLTAVQYTTRQLQRLGEPFTLPSGSEESSFEIPDQRPSLLAQILEKEHVSEVMGFIQDLRVRRPRAKDQIDVLELRWLEDIDYAEIAKRLKISRSIAYQRLSRILKTIHNTPDLSQRARELGLEYDSKTAAL